MLKPQHFGPEEAHRRGIPSGWWATDQNKRPVIGPYQSEGAAAAGIAGRAPKKSDKQH